MLTKRKVNPSTTASFSASILESICEIDPNKITNEICFCFDTTTAEALKGITNKIILPEVPNMDLFVETVIEEFQE